jgi:hypothetical protein
MLTKKNSFLKEIESDSKNDNDVLAEIFSKMSIGEDTSAILSDETSSSNGSTVGASSNSQKLEKLNEFLRVCGKTESSIGQPKKLWQNLSMRSRNYHVSKATNAIVASLEVITPGDAGSLWEAVQTSQSVEKALGMPQPAERKYLEALAETYHKL